MAKHVISTWRDDNGNLRARCAAGDWDAEPTRDVDEYAKQIGAHVLEAAARTTGAGLRAQDRGDAEADERERFASPTPPC